MEELADRHVGYTAVQRDMLHTLVRGAGRRSLKGRQYMNSRDKGHTGCPASCIVWGGGGAVQCGASGIPASTHRPPGIRLCNTWPAYQPPATCDGTYRERPFGHPVGRPDSVMGAQLLPNIRKQCFVHSGSSLLWCILYCSSCLLLRPLQQEAAESRYSGCHNTRVHDCTDTVRLCCKQTWPTIFRGSLPVYLPSSAPSAASSSRTTLVTLGGCTKTRRLHWE